MGEISDHQKKLSSFNAKNAKRKAIVLAGPTASGKTGFSIALARETNGVVINADSMQVFADVPTLTAQPTPAETGDIPHRLFGFLEPDADFSVQAWTDLCVQTLNAVWNAGKTPIITGGTGLYFKALIDGLNPMPVIPDAVRVAVRDRMARLGRDAFLRDYLTRDPDFRFTDPQRLARAAEVLEASGKPISFWQSRPVQKAVEADFYTFVLMPDRPTLYKRCDQRFDIMMNSPVFEEIDALFAKNPPENALILKAVGVRELRAAQTGQMSLNDAVALSKQHTRNYAKRQITWFTHQMRAQKIVSNNNFDEMLTNALRFLR